MPFLQLQINTPPTYSTHPATNSWALSKSFDVVKRTLQCNLNDIIKIICSSVICMKLAANGNEIGRKLNELNFDRVNGCDFRTNANIFRGRKLT